jgi:hypothetical protein
MIITLTEWHRRPPQRDKCETMGHAQSIIFTDHIPIDSQHPYPFDRCRDIHIFRGHVPVKPYIGASVHELVRHGCFCYIFIFGSPLLGFEHVLSYVYVPFSRGEQNMSVQDVFFFECILQVSIRCHALDYTGIIGEHTMSHRYPVVVR